MFAVDAKQSIAGGEIPIDLVVMNFSSEKRTFSYRITGCPIRYTGKRGKPTVSIRKHVTLEPNSRK